MRVQTSRSQRQEDKMNEFITWDAYALVKIHRKPLFSVWKEYKMAHKDQIYFTVYSSKPVNLCWIIDCPKSHFLYLTIWMISISLSLSALELKNFTAIYEPFCIKECHTHEDQTKSNIFTNDKVRGYHGRRFLEEQVPDLRESECIFSLCFVCAYRHPPAPTWHAAEHRWECPRWICECTTKSNGSREDHRFPHQRSAEYLWSKRPESVQRKMSITSSRIIKFSRT